MRAGGARGKRFACYGCAHIAAGVPVGPRRGRGGVGPGDILWCVCVLLCCEASAKPSGLTVPRPACVVVRGVAAGMHSAASQLCVRRKHPVS